MGTPAVTPNIQGLPAGATLKPIQGLPPGAELRPVQHTVTDQNEKQNFDNAPQANSGFFGPIQDLYDDAEKAPAVHSGSPAGIHGLGLSNLGAMARGVGDLAYPIMHPFKTAEALPKAMVGPHGFGLADTMATGLFHDAKENPGEALPRFLGQMAGGELAAEAGPALKAGGKAVRSAAIGDIDAAALRGLQIGPKSDSQLSTLRSVEKARPYLAGASSQADMQARLKPAMNEVWNPYTSTVDAIGDRPVQGPDGMTTVRELEAERLRLSALNRGVKSGNPSDLHQAIQEGRTPAQLIEREERVKAALDPHLASTGIKPTELRDTYGALADVRNGVEGKSTLNEKPKPSGFGRLLNVDPLKPKTFLGEPAQGIRDLAAGRPLWSAKPTDLGIKEGFATGGPKPDLGRLRAPDLNESRPLGLHAPPIELGPAPEATGTPEGYRPPPFYHDTDAMRLGRLLHAPPIELGGVTEGPKGQGFRYDTGPMRMGKTLPESTGNDMPLSSHADIFKDQIPQTTRVKPKPKTIEGKK